MQPIERFGFDAAIIFSDILVIPEAMGMGYYFRQQHELLLVAARGALPVPEPHARPASVIRTRRRAHSEKPTVLYEFLERMYPQLTEQTRVELFARAPRVGWAAWGNEL